jgi:RNA polymerase sigma factor (sigma-70 family)
MEARLDVAAVGSGSRATTRTDLVQAAVLGDRDAFARLVEPELAVALGASILLTRSHADAGDAVQDALLSAWQGLDRLRDPVAFPAWFRTHVVRAGVRTARRRRGVLELDVRMPAEVDTLDRSFERRQLRRAFDRLGADDRLLVTLRYLWDAPVAETAAILGIPEGTVKSRTHAVLERLRANYEAEERR